MDIRKTGADLWYLYLSKTLYDKVRGYYYKHLPNVINVHYQLGEWVLMTSVHCGLPFQIRCQYITLILTST